MGLSVRQIEQVAQEINPDLLNGNIQSIDQVQTCSILFEVVQGGLRRRLFFSADQARSRYHLSTTKYQKPTTPPRFCQLLRAHLRHKRIISLRQVPGDRIIIMKAVWHSEGDSGERTFVAELCGPASNFFLLDSGEKVIDSLNRTRGRKLAPGTVYHPPVHYHTTSFTETRIPLLSTDSHPLSTSIEQYFCSLEAQETQAEKEKAILSRFDHKINSCRKRIKHLTVNLREADKSRSYRQQGEILKAHLHELTQGMSRVEFPDPLDQDLPHKPIEIILDQSMSPAQNMAHFFRRWKKAEAAKLSLKQVIDASTHHLKQLESEKAYFLQTGSLDPTSSLNLYQKNEKARQSKSAKTTQKYAVYLSSDQMRLMLGRTALENDRLSFRIARGNDLWFHACDAPGSHLIVRMERRKEIPYQTLLDAATLALHFSRLKKAGKGEVLYTYKKYLRKPKKGLPGAVICSEEKTLYIEMDPIRLNRLLQNRLESE